MARRGPKRKLGGKKRAQSYTVVGGDTDFPAPPALTDTAMEEWGRITTALRNAGRLYAVHYASVVMACKAWARFLILEAQIEQEGETYKTEDYIKENPAVGALHKMSNIHAQKLEKLGLTSHAMHRFGDGEQQDATDELAEFGKEKPVLRAVNE